MSTRSNKKKGKLKLAYNIKSSKESKLFVFSTRNYRNVDKSREPVMMIEIETLMTLFWPQKHFKARKGGLINHVRILFERKLLSGSLLLAQIHFLAFFHLI